MSTKQESATGEMAPPPYHNQQDQRYPHPPNQQHYHPPNQPYYPPPQQQPYYQPPPMQQMQTSNNVTIVNNSTPGTHTVVVKQGVNHCLHCCISIFFFPWIIVWMILCCVYGC